MNNASTGPQNDPSVPPAPPSVSLPAGLDRCLEYAKTSGRPIGILICAWFLCFVLGMLLLSLEWGAFNMGLFFWTANGAVLLALVVAVFCRVEGAREWVSDLFGILAAEQPNEQSDIGRSIESWLSYRLIAALSVAGIISSSLLTSFMAYRFGALGSIALALALGALCFRLRLVTRWIVAVLMAAAVIFSVLSLSGFTAAAFYGAGLPMVNSFTDPMEREFWQDFEKVTPIPKDVFVETDTGTQHFRISNEAELAEALPAMYASEGQHILQSSGAAFLNLGLAIGLAGVALRLLGWPRDPAASAGAAPGKRLGRADKVGLVLAAMGLFLYFFAQTPAFIDEVILYDAIDYRTAGGMNADSAWLWWSIWTLDKIAFIGSITAFCGIVVLIIGGPRRREVVLGRGWGRRRMLGLSAIWLNIVAWALLAFAITLGAFLGSILAIALEITWFVTRDIYIDFGKNYFWTDDLPLYSGVLGVFLFIAGARKPEFDVMSFLMDTFRHPGAFLAFILETLIGLIAGVSSLIRGELHDAYQLISDLVSRWVTIILVLLAPFVVIGGAIWLLTVLLGISSDMWVKPVGLMALGVFLFGLAIVPVEYK